MPIATVYLSRDLVDSLVEALNGGGPIQPALVWVGLMALALLAGEIMNSLSTWVRNAQS